MNNEKDRFGELMRLIERAREDIYFAQKDRDLIEKLKAEIAKDESDREKRPECPHDSGTAQVYNLDLSTLRYLFDSRVA